MERARNKKEKWKLARILVNEIVERATTESEQGHVRQLLEETLQDGWSRIEVKEEKRMKAREKRKAWELKRIARLITTGVVEEAVSRSEMKHIESIVEDILLEGWRRVETTRILQIMDETEEEVQERVLKACMIKKEEEGNLLAALSMEEDRQRRLERTRTLKLILGKKLGAKSLRSMMIMMKNMSLEELEMEVDALEDRAREMMERMETGDEADVHPDYQEEYEDTVVEMMEVSPVDGNKISSDNNSGTLHLAQIGQNRNQKSRIKSIPRIVNSKVEMKPTINNILLYSPLSGQTRFHISGLCGGRKRKLELIGDKPGPDEFGCEGSGPGMNKRIKLSNL